MCGSIKLLGSRCVNIFPSVNIPPVVNLIVQTPTQVFLYSDTIWVCTACTTGESGGNVWSLALHLTQRACVCFSPSHRNNKQQQRSLLLHLLVRIKRGKPYLFTVWHFGFHQEPKRRWLLLRGPCVTAVVCTCFVFFHCPRPCLHMHNQTTICVTV